MSAFYMDVYDAAGVKLNDTATELTNVRTTDRINRIGEVTFTLPAHLARDMSLQPGRRYKLYHSALSYLGVYRHDRMTVDADNLTATITALDSLVALDNICTGFNWSHDGTDTISTILNALVTYAGWTVSYESGFTDSYPAIEWQGESVLTALDRLRQFSRGYFRRQTDTSIKFGLFANLGSSWSSYGGFTYGSGAYKGDGTGVPADTQAWLLNPPVISADIEGATAIYATITSLKRESSGSAIINRVFPLGAGQGQAQLNLSHSDRAAPYTRQSRTNEDGVTLAYYIEHAASIAAYGAVERVLPFSDIRPITNSAADLLAAGNALYDMAVAYMDRFSVPQEIYSVSCVGLPAAVKPGDIIAINYYGVVEESDGANAYLTLENAPFYVTEITRDYGDSGNPVAQLVISTSGEAQATTVDVFTHVLQDLDKFKVRPQPSQTYFTKAAPSLPIASGKNVIFKFWLGPEVLLLNEMRIEFRVMPLRSMASNATSSTSVTGNTDTAGAVSPATSTDTTTHNHQIPLAGMGGGYIVMTDGNQLGFSAGPSSTPAVTSNGGNHSHTLTIGAHSHVFGAGSAHTHALSFGVVDDTVAPTTLAVYVNGTLATHIRNVETGADVGSSVSAAGLYDVDILALLTAAAWRETTHTIEFSCVSGQGQVFAQVLGRITIQPIAVS